MENTHRVAPKICPLNTIASVISSPGSFPYLCQEGGFSYHCREEGCAWWIEDSTDKDRSCCAIAKIGIGAI